MESAGGITWKVIIRKLGTLPAKSRRILATRNKNNKTNNRNRRCSFFIAIGGTYEVYDISLLERMVNCRFVGKPEVMARIESHGITSA